MSRNFERRQMSWNTKTYYKVKALEERVASLEKYMTLLEELVERMGEIVEKLAAWHDREHSFVLDEAIYPTFLLSIRGQQMKRQIEAMQDELGKSKEEE